MLNNLVKEILDVEKAKIREANIIGEGEELSKFYSMVFGLDIKSSYAREMASLKEKSRTDTPAGLDQTLTLLESFFYFSYAHDMAYKEKIKADCFMQEPLLMIEIDMLGEINELFNDVSVMPDNIYYEQNVAAIKAIIRKYLDFNSLLLLLYVNDWQFPAGWEALYPENADKLSEMIDTSKITIGHFLSALIGHKISEMRKVMSSIEDPDLNFTYAKKIGEIEAKKQQEAFGYNHVHLPVGYFRYNSIFSIPPKPSSIIVPNVLNP